MIEKIEHLLVSVKEKEQLKRTAEIAFLQAQVKPHFLYNTLNSIRCMVDMNRNQDATKMLLALMRLLRKTLTNHDELISIREELTILQDYITLQSYRLQDKFTVQINVSQALLEYKIPKLLLQPLVENAITHGIEPIYGKGMLTIEATEHAEFITFKIMDNGVGIPKENIADILDNKRNPQTSGGIGIANVHERIKLHFGQAFGIEIASSFEHGTTIYVKIPILK